MPVGVVSLYLDFPFRGLIGEAETAVKRAKLFFERSIARDQLRAILQPRDIFEETGVHQTGMKRDMTSGLPCLGVGPTDLELPVDHEAPNTIGITHGLFRGAGDFAPAQCRERSKVIDPFDTV